MMQSTQRKASNPTRMKKNDTRMAANPASPPDSWSFAAHSTWIRVIHPHQLLISCVSPGSLAAIRVEKPLMPSILNANIRE